MLCSFSTLLAQRLPITDQTEISVLTIGPGTQLYDSFGHSAFRIKDPTTNIDLVFNYGVYDFNTPNFYTKFARGKLLYKLVVSEYTPFIQGYIQQKRWIKEQTLQLNYSQKNELSAFLINNAKPENKYYKYDFFYDNCATKIRDVLQNVLEENLVYSKELPDETNETFRSLINQRIPYNSWGSLGINIALGATIDKQLTPEEYQFLPEYVFTALSNANLVQDGVSTPIVKQVQILNDVENPKAKTNFLSSPLFWISLLSLLLIGFTYKQFLKNKKGSRLNVAIAIFLSCIGLLLCFLWWGTDHTATANNYNLLWAFPLAFLGLLSIGKPETQWSYRFYFLLCVLLALLVLHWFTGVQFFTPILIPLLLALFSRYIFVLYSIKKES